MKCDKYCSVLAMDKGEKNLKMGGDSVMVK